MLFRSEIDHVDFNDSSAILHFTNNINTLLLSDVRDNMNNQERDIESQLKKGHTKQELYAQEQTQKHLAQEVFRFHVLANSDSEKDQNLKLQVRDAVLDYMKEELSEEPEEKQCLKQTVQWARTHTDEIRAIGEKTVATAGEDQSVNVAVTTCYFPDRTYGDVTFPAGNYQALRVELGSAEGHNWWCVLYPNLCFLDTTNAVVPDKGKKQLKQVLTEEEYSKVTANTKFKIGWYFWK